MKCPNHGTKLETQKTQWGLRHYCPAEGCTVVCWGNETSTPADFETRQLRSELHRLVKPIWRNGRNKIYSTLRHKLNLPTKGAQIGMLSKEQCVKAKPLLEKIVEAEK